MQMNNNPKIISKDLLRQTTAVFCSSHVCLILRTCLNANFNTDTQIKNSLLEVRSSGIVLLIWACVVNVKGFLFTWEIMFLLSTILSFVVFQAFWCS